jgi:hypothetical protein
VYEYITNTKENRPALAATLTVDFVATRSVALWLPN